MESVEGESKSPEFVLVVIRMLHVVSGVWVKW